MGGDIVVGVFALLNMADSTLPVCGLLCSVGNKGPVWGVKGFDLCG